MNTEQQLAKVVSAICDQHEWTRGAVAAGVLVTSHALVIPLKRPVVVEGEALDVSQTIDILDLIDTWREENAPNQARG